MEQLRQATSDEAPASRKRPAGATGAHLPPDELPWPRQHAMVRGSEVLADVELDVAEGLKEDFLRRRMSGGRTVDAPNSMSGGGAYPILVAGCGTDIQMRHVR
jgi:hypothetical protein